MTKTHVALIGWALGFLAMLLIMLDAALQPPLHVELLFLMGYWIATTLYVAAIKEENEVVADD